MGRARGGPRSISTGERRRVVDDYGATDPFGDLFGAGRGRAQNGSSPDEEFNLRERQRRLTELVASVKYTMGDVLTKAGPEDRYAVIGFSEHDSHEHVLGVCADQAGVLALAERAQREEGFKSTVVIDLDTDINGTECTTPISYNSRTNQWGCDLEDHRS